MSSSLRPKTLRSRLIFGQIVVLVVLTVVTGVVAVFALHGFLTRDLEMDPVVFGILFAIGGVASFFGAVAAGTIERRLGSASAWNVRSSTASVMPPTVANT